MREFRSEHLSPRRLEEPVPCKLPYELGWADVGRCLPGFDFSRAGEAQAFRAFDKRGRFQGDEGSRILTFRYPTLDGTWSETTAFVKGIVDPRHRESEKYAFLARHDVPTPRLLGSVARDGGEVIVTEFLPRIGINFDAPSEIDDLLRLLARLNSVQVRPDTFHAGPGMPREQMDARRKTALARLATDPRTGVDVGRWFEAFRAARDIVDVMPLALAHGEFSFQQSGWSNRDDDETLVILDLATMALHPRFADLVSILPAIASETGRPEIELLDLYLTFVMRFTGVAVSPQEAMRELRVFRIYDRISALYWLTHDVYERGSEELVLIANGLHRDMVKVGLISVS